MNISRIIFPILFFFFVLNKVNAQEITMFPSFWGLEYYQDEIKIDKADVSQLMKSHELSNLYWTKSRRHNKIAIIAFGTQLVTSYLAINSLNNTLGPSDNKDLILLATSLGAAGIAIGYSFSSASLKKKAILGYNKIQQQDGYIFHIGQTHNGLGIVCSF